MRFDRFAGNTLAVTLWGPNQEVRGKAYLWAPPGRRLVALSRRRLIEALHWSNDDEQASLTQDEIESWKDHPALSREADAFAGGLRSPGLVPQVETSSRMLEQPPPSNLFWRLLGPKPREPWHSPTGLTFVSGLRRAMWLLAEGAGVIPVEVVGSDGAATVVENVAGAGSLIQMNLDVVGADGKSTGQFQAYVQERLREKMQAEEMARGLPKRDLSRHWIS